MIKGRSNNQGADGPLRSAAGGCRPCWRTVLSLCFLGAATACYSVSASAEIWSVGSGTNWIHSVHIPAGGTHNLKICIPGQDMQTTYKEKGAKLSEAAVPFIIEWSRAGSNSILFPTPDFKLPLQDTFVKTGTGAYCDKGRSFKSSDFPSSGAFQMYGLPQDYPDMKLFQVTWTVAPTINRVANPASVITRVRPAMLGDTRPTFKRPLKHENFVGKNITLAITSHVASRFCSAGHYELAWQRARVPDQRNGFPGAMEPWLAGPELKLPCHGGTPSMAVVPFAELRSRSRAFHYKYHVRARLVGSDFHGAWSPWREFAVEEPALRMQAPTGFKMNPSPGLSGMQSGQSSGTSTQRMTAPLRPMQIHR